jgi:DNA-binding Lrp family transcriptional regulator
MTERGRLDRTDYEILGQLQNNARLANKELAKRVHLAPSSCLERVRRLRESGVLTGFHAQVDPAALGIAMQAMIAVRLADHSGHIERTFRDYLLQRPEVVAVFYLAGAIDFLVHVAVRDTAHLRDFSVDALAARAEVDRVETSLIFEHSMRPSLPNYAAKGAIG